MTHESFVSLRSPGLVRSLPSVPSGQALWGNTSASDEGMTIPFSTKLAEDFHLAVQGYRTSEKEE